MAELGFVRSSAARMMRASKSGLIGLITGAISQSPEPSEPAGLPDLFIVQGIQRAIAAEGKTLMIADTGGHSDKVAHLMHTFLEHRVEGLIYVADYHQEVALPPVRRHTPLVLANCFDGADTPAVVPDDRRGQRELVARLIVAGHSRIGYLTLQRRMVATGLRLAGYRDAPEAAGIAPDPVLVVTGYLEGQGHDSRLLWEAIDRLLSLPEPPTVLCCGNDEMAMRAYGILRTRGLRVPEEIGVAGFDNYRIIAEPLYPPLTTVELPYVAIGMRAAETLLSLINGDGPMQSNPTLVAGPVSWRSSVTAISNVTKLETKGRTI